MAQAFGLGSFAALNFITKVFCVDAGSQGRKGLGRAVIIAAIVAPAAFWIILTIGNAIFQPTPYSYSVRYLAAAPQVLVGALIRCFLPLVSYIFLGEYCMSSNHFDKYVADATNMNPALPSNLSRYGRRLEIAFLLIIAPCYALIEVLSAILNADFSNLYEAVNTVINVIASPLHIMIVSTATFVSVLLAFTVILDINNYIAMIPTLELDKAIEEWTRLVTVIKTASRRTANFHAVLYGATTVRWILQIAQVFITGAAPVLGTTALFLLMTSFAIRIQAWVTDRLRGAVDELHDEYGRHASPTLVQFWLKVSAVRPAWRVFGIAITPGSFLLFIFSYLLTFIAVVLLATIQIMNVPNPEPFLRY